MKRKVIFKAHFQFIDKIKTSIMKSLEEKKIIYFKINSSRKCLCQLETARVNMQIIGKCYSEHF
uniref:Uncharacterized protein n=1 Tax=Octopus bimaculoides TaxID=37653 RepID=A0A0L8GFK5_OCTBM